MEPRIRSMRSLNRITSFLPSRYKNDENSRNTSQVSYVHTEESSNSPDRSHSHGPKHVTIDLRNSGKKLPVPRTGNVRKVMEENFYQRINKHKSLKIHLGISVLKKVPIDEPFGESYFTRKLASKEESLKKFYMKNSLYNN